MSNIEETGTSPMPDEIARKDKGFCVNHKNPYKETHVYVGPDDKRSCRFQTILTGYLTIERS